MQALDDVKIIWNDSKINVQKILCKNVLDWYQLYTNHPGGSRLAKKIREVCYWKGLVTQAELSTKTCKTCQHFKRRKTLYGNLPPKNISVLKLWDLVHVDLICPYSKSIRQHQPGGTIIWKNASITCTTMIGPATGWFEIVKIPTLSLKEVTEGNDEYIDKSSAMVSQLFSNTWLCIYPRTRKVVFDSGSEFKRDLTTLINDFDIKPILIYIKNPQANAPVKRLHQVKLNMIVTKDLDNKEFDHIYPWGETLVYTAWVIRDSYHRTKMDMPDQYIFGRDMLFNLSSVVDWQVLTPAKQRKVDINNFRENARQVTDDYAIGDWVYVEMIGIYRKLDYKKQGQYIIPEVFTNVTVRFQWGQVNKWINIIQVNPHFDE